jgi:hypothetical protein
VQLFDLSFFINYVLTDNRIKLFDLKLFWLRTLVFSGCVKVASASAGLKLDFVTHDEFLKDYVAQLTANTLTQGEKSSRART